MCVSKVAVLLLLAVIGSYAEPSAEECEGLTKRLPSKDLNKIFGKWVLVWSVTDRETGRSLLANISSSHVDFKLLADNKTIEYIERNVYLGSLDSCTTFFINMTLPTDDSTEHHTLKADFNRVEKDGVVQEYNDTGDVDFYESCDDCLLMTYKTSIFGLLLSYKRKGSNWDVEQMKTAHDGLKKTAECLKFIHDKPFTYDGLTDLCNKKSAPDASS
ncbi:saxitoxin and tetrodotoxin-binding protein 1-like [Odontesthes bonariensis]|uniref:saxitoxin and tetrodotoxin-binding protein 1-like n=1 Tax=Odontesthes bonariensis TaxID=219752 RepID=UPI003F58AC2B